MGPNQTSETTQSGAKSDKHTHSSPWRENTNNITRFPTRGHYATYNATAPIEVSSAGNTRHRLNLRGNRILNHAIHIAAVTQLRHDTIGRVYFDKKIAEGKTPKEAIRALKRRISDAVYRALVVDAARPAAN